MSSKETQRPLWCLFFLQVKVFSLPLPRGLEEAGTDAIGAALVGIGHLQDPRVGNRLP